MSFDKYNADRRLEVGLHHRPARRKDGVLDTRKATHKPPVDRMDIIMQSVDAGYRRVAVDRKWGQQSF